METNKKEIIKQKVKISDYFPKEALTKTAEGFKACCPFHKETLPSFYINEVNGVELYHCFGCEKGGDIFSFLQEKECKDFDEVYNELLVKIGIEESSSITKKTIKKTKTSDILLQSVNTYLMQTLIKKQDVLDYLQKTRGLTMETIKTFQLGWSEGKILSLINTLSYNLETCADLGIIKKGENGFYDTIKNRITIPLFAKDGKMIGISSRAFLDTDTGGKYIHPPNNKVFKKNSILYGYNLTKEEIKKENKVIIIEGQFDLLKLYQSGIKNVVSVLGTNIFSDQVKQISKLTENYYFCFDGDNAGRDAIIKNIKEVIKQGDNIFIINLPEKEDPDSYIDKYGKDKFLELVKNAESILDFIASSKESMIPMLEELSKIIPKITSSVKKQFWYKNILKYTGIDLTKDIKKEYFSRQKNETLTLNDTLFLKTFINGTDEAKELLSKTPFYETERAKLLYFKIKNTIFNIAFTEEELQIMESLTLSKKYEIKDVETILKRLKENDKLK